jgi:hypothetical protein
MPPTPENEQIARHAASVFGGTPVVAAYHHDTEPLTIDMLSCGDRPNRGVTCYSTLGLSDVALANADGSEFPGRMEIAGACATAKEAFANVLAAAAFRIMRAGCLYPPGSIMPLDVAEYFPETTVPHLYFTAPFLWEDTLRTLDCGTKRVSWVLAIPISEGERQYLLEHGDQALEALFEREQIDIFNLWRRSTVEEVIPTVAQIEKWFDVKFPAVYRAFLEEHAEGLEASDFVWLYGRDLFIDRNETHEVKEYCPGYVSIGNDSGDMEFLLPLAGGPVLMVDAGSMRPEDGEVVCEDLTAWVPAGCPLPDDEVDANGWSALTDVCIYLVRRPADLTTLLRIKEILGLQTSIGEFKRSLDSIPCAIGEGFAYAKAKIVCSEANAVEDCLEIRLAADPSVELPIE